jgi:hypothetical protein
LDGYVEDSQRHNHPSWMVMPKTVNGQSAVIRGEK